MKVKVSLCDSPDPQCNLNKIIQAFAVTWNLVITKIIEIMTAKLKCARYLNGCRWRPCNQIELTSNGGGRKSCRVWGGERLDGHAIIRKCRE